VWNSQNDKHHVKLKLKIPLSIEMRLFLQTCLGSDVNRELLTYKRILEGETEPSMLFRPRKWGNAWKKPGSAKLVEPAYAREMPASEVLQQAIQQTEPYPDHIPTDSQRW
jgi:hypothetical protein